MRKKILLNNNERKLDCVHLFVVFLLNINKMKWICILQIINVQKERERKKERKSKIKNAHNLIDA